MNAADALVATYRGWAERLARRRARRLPNIDEDEAVGEALVALVQTSRSFDPRTGVKFTTWAERRISGAVLDAHRRVDPMGRWGRQALKEGRETRASRQGIIPRRQDKDVFDLEREGRIRATREPYQEISVEVMEALTAIRALPPRLSDVMERHFFGGETLRKIGRSLGVTESRVCQIVQEGRLMLTGAIPAPAPAPRPVAAQPAAAKSHLAVRIEERAIARKAKRQRSPRDYWLPCGKCGQMGHDGVYHVARARRIKPEAVNA